jgi:hypothetical protein
MRPAAQYGIGLDVAQGALLMEALAALPFRDVFELIGRLNAWALDTCPAGPGARVSVPLPFPVSDAELALVLKALGEMPHRRVHQLIASLQGYLAQIDGVATHG